jgi:tRNA (guanine10-N2)-dimethyltransferase
MRGQQIDYTGARVPITPEHEYLFQMPSPIDRGVKLLFELSGEHPTLPLAEIECVGEVIDSRCQVAVAECPDPGAVCRLAFTHTVLEYLGECPPSRAAIEALLRNLAIRAPRPFAARVKKVCGSQADESQLSLERCIGYHIGGRVALDNPLEEYRALISEDRCYFGRVIARINRGAFDRRRPKDRPFFHPGVMMPRTARALVNLSMARAGERILDPFCGTGGILVEGHLIGADVLGADVDPEMAQGSRRNLPAADIILADATQMPVRASSIDAVVTDLPYGQSVCIKAHTLDDLYRDSFLEMLRVLRPGRRAVVVTHRDIRQIVPESFEILQYHEQRVHKSLTRRILVLEKKI